MNSNEPEPNPGVQINKQAMPAFDGVAVRSTIQQIGAINIGGMTEAQFNAIMEQLGLIMQRMGVPTQISAEGPTVPLSPQAQQVAQAVAEKVEEGQKRFGAPVGDPGVYLQLGNVAYEGKNYAEALSYYEQALAIDPKYAYAWNNRGYALDDLERYEEAVASYDKALAIDPKYAYAWNNRGYALDDLKRYEEAVASYDKALAIDPKYAAAWNNRGVALEKMGRQREAQESFRKAEELRK